MKTQEFNKFNSLIQQATSIYDFANILKKINCYKDSPEKTLLLQQHQTASQKADKTITNITIKKQPVVTK